MTARATRSPDPTFTALDLDALADAALSRARDRGATHADVRVERLDTCETALRDLAVERHAPTRERGMAVRVIARGTWGFAAGSVLTPEAAVALADEAVALAELSADLTDRVVELADEPVHRGEWVSPHEINPVTVPGAERIERLRELSARLGSAAGVSSVRAELTTVDECLFYADTAGSRTVQQRVRLHPQLTAVHVGEEGFTTLRTLAPPVARGWEYLLGGAGWDVDAELAALPDLLAEKVAAPSVEAGVSDLVIDPTNLWLTIHESVAHATELDRALGDEAAYAGTSFATVDQLGTLQYGSPAMTVTGERTSEHGLASIGWDTEGVAAQEFDIIRDGVLVGYQLNRQMAAQQGLGRSNGCAFADSPAHVPLQRMPNVSLAAAPSGPTTSELIGRVENGLYVVGDGSWSIDMQRHNFQFTAQRFHRIVDGEVVGQVRDAAYQGSTVAFWNSLEAVGGPSTWSMQGAFNCGKGQPGQVAAVSHGAPSALVRGVNVLNIVSEATA